MQETTIRVLDRAIDILQSFSYDEGGQSLTQICEKVALPKTTVFRIINSLEMHNFLVQDSTTGKYHLGHELIKLGAQAQNGIELSKVAHKSMVRVSKTTRQTCNLYVLEGYERLCIAQVAGSEYIRRYSYLGARHPLHCGAGKLLLAYQSREYLEEYFANTVRDRYTENTLTEPEDIERELEKIRKQGYSVSIGERDDFSAAVAVPVRDYTRKVVATLTISGPPYYFTEENIPGYVDVLQKEAHRLSEKLGY